MNLLLVTVLTSTALTFLGAVLLWDRRRKLREPLSGHRQALKSLRGIRRAEGLEPFVTVDHRLWVYRHRRALSEEKRRAGGGP